MKIELNTYKEDKSNLQITWENNEFEQSIIKEVFGKDKSVLAVRYVNCIMLEEMDDELDKIIQKYFKKKELKDSSKTVSAKSEEEKE